MNLDELGSLATRAAEAGAACAREWLLPGRPLGARQKAGPKDLVSEADLATELAVRAVLSAERPHDAVLGEEHGGTEGDSGIDWLVDPIDGTTSYLYGRDDWAVSVAARDRDGRILVAAVAEPAQGRVTTAQLGGGTWAEGRRQAVHREHALAEALVEVNLGTPRQQRRAGAMVDALLLRVRDLRRGGSAASALAHLANGRADAVWCPGIQPWDGAAGVLLASEAGAVVGDLHGRADGRWQASGDVLAAPAHLWEPLRALLATAYH